MRSIAVHPVLRTSEAVSLFLTVHGDLTSNVAWQLMQNAKPSSLDHLKVCARQVSQAMVSG